METIVLAILAFVAAFWATNKFVPENYRTILNFVLMGAAVIFIVRLVF